MRIGIIGAGALGGTFAVLLERAGHEIQVTARGSGLAAIRAGGIRLSGGFGDGHGHPDATPTLSGAFDLVLVCTKAQDAEDAIAANAADVNGSPVIVVQNGLDGVRTASGLLPDSDCFGALSIIAANYTEPGAVRVTTRAATYLGRGSGPADAASKRWAAVLSEAVPVIAVDDFVGAQWTKLVVNMLNGLPAITGLSVQEIIADRDLRRVLTASMREAVRTGMARGIRFGSLQGLSDSRLRFFSRLPLALGQALPRSMGVRMGSVPNLGSTLQSLRRGQRTEIDFLNGAVVREADAAGTTAPVNAAIVEMVHEVEASGASIGRDEVLRRISVR
ncbi:MAG: 2-dehydropantoate 2-reductase [Leifsonia flava]